MRELDLYPIDIQELIINKYIIFNTFKCIECNQNINYFSFKIRKCEKCLNHLCLKHYNLGLKDANLLNRKYDCVCETCFWFEII